MIKNKIRNKIQKPALGVPVIDGFKKMQKPALVETAFDILKK